MFIRFLVGILIISAQRGRYYSFFTGTIFNFKHSLITAFFVLNKYIIIIFTTLKELDKY